MCLLGGGGIGEGYAERLCVKVGNDVSHFNASFSFINCGEQSKVGDDISHFGASLIMENKVRLAMISAISMLL